LIVFLHVFVTVRTVY